MNAQTGHIISEDEAREILRSGGPFSVFERRLAYSVVVQAEQIAALRSALERTEGNFRLAVHGHPVRDMAENLAENAAALGVSGE